jgi:hypothetical protein
MGLLEDAIREHLELKRLRGADPAEVAREQREALDASAREASSELLEDRTAVGEDGADTAGHAPAAEPAAGDDHPGDLPQGPVASEPSHAAQETAELDMNSVIAQEPAIGDELPPRERADMPDAEGDPPALAADEESLEWEVPARAHDAETDSGPQDGRNRDDVGEMAREQDVPQDAAYDGQEGRAEKQERAPGQGRFSL